MLGANLVKEVRAIERRFEDRSIGHTQILLDVHLHLGCSRSRKCNERSLADIVDNGAYAAILRAEIVSPLRDTVRLVDGIERNFDLAQECHIILLCERLGGKVQQFGLACQNVATHLIDRCLVERRVQKVGNTRLGGERAHSIDLILHQGDKGRDDDCHTIHNKRRQLVAQRLTTARRHQHKGVASLEQVTNYSLLITLE